MTLAGKDQVLTETVDRSAGQVRLSGHLTRQGADLVWGTVDSLLRFGHRRVVVDLAGLRGADEAGLRALRAMRADPGVRLHGPAPTG